MPVQQHKAPCIISRVLFCKKVLYTFFEGVTYAVFFETSFPTTALLAAFAVNPTSGVREVCSNYQCIHTLSLMCQCVMSGKAMTVQFTAPKLPSIPQ
jgi:hypothetical protein